jgi:hypothetical protein
MHRATLARPQRRTRTARYLRTRTLKNRLTWHRTTGHRAGRDRDTGLYGLGRGCLVNGPRSSLRNNHARRRWPGCRRLAGHRSTGRCDRRGWGRSGLRRDLSRRAGRYSRRWCNRPRRRWSRGARCCGRGRFHHGRSHRNSRDRARHRLRRDEARCGWWRRWGRRLRGSRWSRCRCGRGRYLGLDGRRGRAHGRCWRRSRGRRSLLLLGDELEHIAGLGDVRQVNLGFDFVSFPAGA